MPQANIIAQLQGVCTMYTASDISFVDGNMELLEVCNIC